MPPMDSVAPDSVAAYESWPGTGLADPPLLLPVEWARKVHDVHVAVRFSSYRGWTARVIGDGFVVLDLPWHDHVERVLDERAEDRPGDRLPARAPVDHWWDSDQCWDATITRLGDEIRDIPRGTPPCHRGPTMQWSPAAVPVVRVPT